MQTSNAFSVLTTMREQTRELLAQGDAVVMQSSTSRGIGFIINGERFFCDAELVREIAVPDELIAVPQSKTWMRGVYNSKGVLFSVVDLGMLSGLDRAIAHQRGHLMILKDAKLQCSLLVNRVVGFRDFNFEGVQERDTDAADASKDEWWDSLSAFMGKAVEEGGETWRYLNVNKLMNSEVFLEVQ